MTDLTSEKLLNRLKDSSRDEISRIEDVNLALEWLTKQLKSLRDEDKSLMKQFRCIREHLNKYIDDKPTHLEVAGGVPRERGQSLFDIYKPEEDMTEIALRRRAFSNMELSNTTSIIDCKFNETF